MNIPPPYDLPTDKQKKLHKAKQLEWITIGFMISIIVVIAMVMGSSEAMKTVWAEDLLALVPPIAFLFAVRFRFKPPNEKFPYGYHRALSIAFLCASVALAGFGAYLLFDAVMKLVQREHPTIGMVEIFGWRVWLGWLMIAALIYSAIPPVVLGYMKLPLARELHEKVLRADADMNKADWLSAVAGIFGILGIGMGWWWADSAAAAVISIEIIRDGFTNLKNAVMELIDHRPLGIEKKKKDKTQERLQYELEQLDWVEQASVRLRELGNLFTGEAYIVPKNENNLLDKLQQASNLVSHIDWRLYDVVIVPVPSLKLEQLHAGGHRNR